jgi:dCTP diphosphatase
LADAADFPLALAFGPFSLSFMNQLNVSAMLKLQRDFVAERRWNRFHTPKNLSMALVGEAAELMEIFQWLTQSESKTVMKNPAKAKGVAHELADVLYYLLRISDVLGVDLEKAFLEKMRHNQEKYPVKLAKGSAKKYNELLEFKGLNPR